MNRTRPATSFGHGTKATFTLRALCISLLLASCGGRSAQSEAAPPERSGESVENAALPRAAHLPLEVHIPSAGLRWLVEVKPRELLQNEAFAASWSRLFRTERIRAFAKVSGFQPSEVETAWIAGYDLGTLYVFDGRRAGAPAEAAFRRRTLTSQDHPTGLANVTHITGLVEQTPHALVHVHGHLVALAHGDVRLAKIVTAYAAGRLERTPTALRDRVLAPFAGHQASAPVRAFLRGPFAEASDAVVQGFISGAAGVHVEGQRLRMQANALGLWPQDQPLDDALTGWVNEVLSTREFRALGWGFPLEAPRVKCTPQSAPRAASQKGRASASDWQRCQTEATWNVDAIADSIYRISAGSMEELLADKAPTGWKHEATTERAPKPDKTKPAGRTGGDGTPTTLP